MQNIANEQTSRHIDTYLFIFVLCYLINKLYSNIYAFILANDCDIILLGFKNY